jgi:hypothetical protein
VVEGELDVSCDAHEERAQDDQGGGQEHPAPHTLPSEPVSEIVRASFLSFIEFLKVLSCEIDPVEIRFIR